MNICVQNTKRSHISIFLYLIIINSVIDYSRGSIVGNNFIKVIMLYTYINILIVNYNYFFNYILSY